MKSLKLEISYKAIGRLISNVKSKDGGNNIRKQKTYIGFAPLAFTKPLLFLRRSDFGKLVAVDFKVFPLNKVLT